MQDAFGGAFGVVELSRLDGPDKRAEADKPQKQRDRDQKDEHVHISPDSA